MSGALVRELWVGTSHLSVLPLATGMARSDVLAVLHSSSLSHQLCDAGAYDVRSGTIRPDLFCTACMTCRISKMGMSIVVCQCVSGVRL